MSVSTDQLKLSRFQQLMLKYPGPWHISLIFERLLARELKSLNYDPHVQYRFHQFFMAIWTVCLVVFPFIPSLYNHQLGTLIIQEISFYANFSTDFGAMSAALAAGNYHCTGCQCERVTQISTDKIVQPAAAEQNSGSSPNAQVFPSDLSHTLEFDV